MNIVFFGSANFALPSLEALLRTQHSISCVVTQPDKLKGRGLLESSTEVKLAALNKGLEIYQPNRINTAESIKFLKGLNPDLFIVIAYGQILSVDVLRVPKIFSINLHASLLPKYRGAAPINWAIISGEIETGLTIIKMNECMDAGEIILQKKVNIESNDTAVTLEKKLAEEGRDLLLECLEKIENKNFQLISQDKSNVSFAPKLKKKDGLINWQAEALEILNLIRGTVDWPGAFTYYKGKLLKIYRAKVVPLARLPATAEWRGAVKGGISRLPGEIVQVSKDGIAVATGKDYLIIEELQLEGRRKMTVGEFIVGYKICAGETIGEKK